MADVAELLMGERAQFITVADFLIDGGAPAFYFYGLLRSAEAAEINIINTKGDFYNEKEF